MQQGAFGSIVTLIAAANRVLISALAAKFPKHEIKLICQAVISNCGRLKKFFDHYFLAFSFPHKLRKYLPAFLFARLSLVFGSMKTIN
jgi:hypothetical protein